MVYRFVFLLFVFLSAIRCDARLGGAGSDETESSSSSSSYESSDNDYSSSDDNSGSGGGGGGGIFGLVLMAGVFLYIIYRAIVDHLLKGFLKRRSFRQKLIKSINTSNLRDKEDRKYFGKETEKQFKEKVIIAFYELQEAWSEQRLDLTRRYLSDGMYQKLQSQIEMMKHLDLKNKLSKIQMDRVRIAFYNEETDFLILDVEVGACLREEYRSGKFPELNSKKDESFTEYYTFIKKMNADKDLYNNKSCPSCGTPLKASETDITRCASCGSVTNSPEFDWILTEITQAKDFKASTRLASYPYANLSESISSYDLCKQYLEDIASNGLVHLRMAQASNNFEKAIRYLSPEYLQTVKNVEDEPFFYYRFYLNDFNLKEIKFNNETRCYDADFFYKEYFHRVRVKGSYLENMEDGVYFYDRCVTLSKHQDAFKNPYSIHRHCCTNCGAPVKNTTDIKCSFCETELNSTKADWVITGVFKVGNE
jgi:uncharacterized Zn finger protein (UPF0148 family)